MYVVILIAFLVNLLSIDFHIGVFPSCTHRANNNDAVTRFQANTVCGTIPARFILRTTVCYHEQIGIIGVKTYVSM